MAEKKKAKTVKTNSKPKSSSSSKSDGIKTGDKVSIEYTGTYDNGEVFDSNVHGDHSHPLEFVVGRGMVIPGFDKAVIGMKNGEEKKFRIPAAEAYGERDENLVKTMPKPEEFPLKLNKEC